MSGDVAQSVIEYMKSYGKEQFYTVRESESAPIEGRLLVIPDGRTAVSIKPFLDEMLDRPARAKGFARTQTVGSFVEYCARHGAGPETAIFANRDGPSLTAIFNYHTTSDQAAGWRDRGASYQFPLSDEWKAWMGVNGKQLAQAEFAAFLESNILDIATPPSPAKLDDPNNIIAGKLGSTFATGQKLMEVSRGIQINENVKVTNAITLATGETQLTYEVTHSDKKGLPLKVPNLFLIGIPVFVNGMGYRLPVQLRYRRKDEELTWTLKIYRPEKALAEAFTGACEQVQKETKLPLFYGAPSAS